MRSCKMTKMHFQLIADVIKDLSVSPTSRHETAVAFASALRKTNPAFDWHRFVDACKTDAEKAVEADERLERTA